MRHQPTAFILAIFALAGGCLAGCAGSAEEAHRPTPKLIPSKPSAEAVFRRAVEEAAKGGLIKVGRSSTIETSCEAAGTHWACNGWFVAETGEYCVSVYAAINSTGHVTGETYGKLPLGEPGGFECKV